MKSRTLIAFWIEMAIVASLSLALSACGGSRGARGTNLAVTGSASGDAFVGGDTVVFTMSVTNNGDDTATDVTITNGLTLLSLESITCTASGSTACPATPSASMKIPSMGPGSSLSFTITATALATANGVLGDTMVATISDDVDRTDNTFTVQANVSTPTSNLIVGGTGPSTIVPGGAFGVFVMTVRNDGPDAATGVRLVDTVGSNLTLTGVACTASGGATCPTVLGVQMLVDDLPAGGSLSFDVTVRVALGTNGAITNAFEATADHDATRDDNKVVAVGNAEANNVGVTASAPSGNVAGGSPTTFTMVVSNDGPATALDVDIADTLDAGLNLAGTITCSASGGAVCPVPTGLSMRAPSIPLGGTLTFTVPASVAAGANGVLGNTMTAIASGDSGPSNNTARAAVNAVSADLGVSETGASNVSAGSAAVFTALVANPASAAATNLTINWTASAAFETTNSVACTGTGGAVCPTVLGSVMTVPSLAAGRSLIFTFTVAVPETARGPITSVVYVSADGDPSLANNTASVTTVASDARNGTYKAYASDGRLYDMTVDFDTGLYTMAGNGQTVQKSFTADANGDYSISATSKFRTAADLLVGGHDFGRGNLPYVAARSFGTTVSELAGTYNMASRNVAADGSSATTRPATARAAGNQLQICELPDGVSPTNNCESAYLKTYVVTLSGDLYTGVEATTGEVMSFREASSGASKILLSTSTLSDGSLQMRIGLADSAALAGGVLRGGSSTGDWVNIELTSTRYLFNGVVNTSGDDANLERIIAPNGSTAGGPFAMAIGTRRTDGVDIYVMQASPLVVVIDNPTVTGAGVMQIAVP